MPPKHRGKGRGGRSDGGWQQQGGSEFRSVRGAGGRTTPDFNSTQRGVPECEGSGAEAISSGGPGQKFNAQEATEWMAKRYQDVLLEYEAQKATGKKEIQNFSDLNSDRAVWGASKPVLPQKEDFVMQLHQAFQPYHKGPPPS